MLKVEVLHVLPKNLLGFIKPFSEGSNLQSLTGV